jgi:ABC-type nickel/cobalt efflux system permease component RcnA
LLQVQYYYNFIESIAYFIAALVPIYFLLKSKSHNNKNNKKYLENISIILVSFIIIQGVYHIAQIMEFKQVAKGILEPLSILVLLFFGLIYLWYVRRERKLHKLKQ